MATGSILMFCRITMVLLFFIAFVRKLLAHRDFLVTIGDFKLFPRRWSNKIVWLVYGGEVMTMIFVGIGGKVLSIGFLLAVALLTLFSIVLIQALWRHIDVSCNCFGRAERRISRYDLIRNLCLISCGLIGLWMAWDTPQNEGNGEFFLLVLMSAVFLLTITNLEDIVETLRRPFPVAEERR